MAKLTGYNIRVCMVVIIATFSHGFGAGSFATSTGQPAFYDYFDLDPTSLHTANILSATNALFFFGCAVGGILQSFLSDWIGRKGAFASAAVLSIIGGALVAGSVAIPMLIVVRLIQGTGLGMFLALVPLYLTEVAPPRHRGLITGLTQIGTGFGYITISWGSLGCYYAKDATLGWRLPLALTVVGPFALLIGLYFVPESPRYLIWKGQNETAWVILQRLHHDPSHTSDSDFMAEFTQIVRQVEIDKEENPTFYKMFKKPSWRRRSLLTMWLLFFQQASGIYGIVNFFPLLLGALGMSGSMALILFGIWQVTATLSLAVAILVVDRFGRRKLLLFGFSSIACILLAETLLQWKYQGTPDKAGNAACILFIFLFVVFFQGIDAPSFVWAAEVFPTTLRAKGVSLAVFAYFAGTITFSTPAPVALNSIKWGMFLIYCVICILSFFVVYFFIPETKGLPVEEIGAFFNDKVAVHLTADGEGIIEEKQGVELVEDSNKVGEKKEQEQGTV